MKIDKLIKELENLKKEFGNVQVKIVADYFIDDIGKVELLHMQNGKKTFLEIQILTRTQVKNNE